MKNIIHEKQKAVEQGLRFTVLFANKTNQKMNIRERMKFYNVQGISIAVISHGEIEWTKTYGLADSDTQQVLSRQTLFQAGSVSKSLTALGIIFLVRQGILSLDTNVNEYLKSWKVPENEFTKNEKVTLRRLLSHSAGLSISGFPGYEIDAVIPTLTQILDAIKPANTDAVRVKTIPGTKWMYSGGGTTICQLLIEDVTKQAFHIWMQENVLNKIGMTFSTFEQSPKNKILASGHDSRGNTIKGKHHVYPEMAAAGLWTNAEDLAKFILFIEENYSRESEFSPLIKEMLKPQIHITGEYYHGLGVLIKTFADEILFEHDGQDEGFITRYKGLLNAKSGFVIMMNSNANGWYLMEEIGNSIVDTYNWKYFDPIYKSIDTNVIDINSNVFGTYKSEEDERKISIFAHNQKLFLNEHPKMPNIELHPENNLQYFTQEGNHCIEFKSPEFNSLKMKDHAGKISIFNKLFE